MVHIYIEDPLVIFTVFSFIRANNCFIIVDTSTFYLRGCLKTLFAHTCSGALALLLGPATHTTIQYKLFIKCQTVDK